MTWRTFIRVWDVSVSIGSNGNVEGVSCTFRYSTKRFRKATKCSALRMFPGTASCSRSSGNAIVCKKITESREAMGRTYQDLP